MKIRIGNDFKTKWAITWMGEPEDFSDATDIALFFNIYDKKIELTKDVDYTIADNIIEIDVTPDICNILGIYNLELHYTKPNEDFIDGERRSAVDIDAFRIVGKSEKADATQDVSIISDAVAIFLDIAYKKLEEIEANEDVRISNEEERVANEDIRISNEQDRQTNTTTAISNAEQATLNANNSAVYANEQGAYAEEMSSHPPTIINDYWHIWNFTTNQYESTGQYARGDSAIDGALVVQEKGQSAVNTMSQKAITDELVQLESEVVQNKNLLTQSYAPNINFIEYFPTLNDLMLKTPEGFLLTSGIGMSWTATIPKYAGKIAIIFDGTVSGIEAPTDKIRFLIQYTGFSAYVEITQNMDGIRVLREVDFNENIANITRIRIQSEGNAKALVRNMYVGNKDRYNEPTLLQYEIDNPTLTVDNLIYLGENKSMLLSNPHDVSTEITEVIDVSEYTRVRLRADISSVGLEENVTTLDLRNHDTGNIVGGTIPRFKHQESRGYGYKGLDVTSVNKLRITVSGQGLLHELVVSESIMTNKTKAVKSFGTDMLFNKQVNLTNLVKNTPINELLDEGLLKYRTTPGEVTFQDEYVGFNGDNGMLIWSVPPTSYDRYFSVVDFRNITGTPKIGYRYSSQGITYFNVKKDESFRLPAGLTDIYINPSGGSIEVKQLYLGRHPYNREWVENPPPREMANYFKNPELNGFQNVITNEEGERAIRIYGDGTEEFIEVKYDKDFNNGVFAFQYKTSVDVIKTWTSDINSAGVPANTFIQGGIYGYPNVNHILQRRFSEDNPGGSLRVYFTGGEEDYLEVSLPSITKDFRGVQDVLINKHTSENQNVGGVAEFDIASDILAENPSGLIKVGEYLLSKKKENPTSKLDFECVNGIKPSSVSRLRDIRYIDTGDWTLLLITTKKRFLFTNPTINQTKYTDNLEECLVATEYEGEERYTIDDSKLILMLSKHSLGIRELSDGELVFWTYGTKHNYTTNKQTQINESDVVPVSVGGRLNGWAYDAYDDTVVYSTYSANPEYGKGSIVLSIDGGRTYHESFNVETDGEALLGSKYSDCHLHGVFIDQYRNALIALVGDYYFDEIANGKILVLEDYKNNTQWRLIESNFENYGPREQYCTGIALAKANLYGTDMNETCIARQAISLKGLDTPREWADRLHIGLDYIPNFTRPIEPGAPVGIHYSYIGAGNPGVPPSSIVLTKDGFYFPVIYTDNVAHGSFWNNNARVWCDNSGNVYCTQFGGRFARSIIMGKYNGYNSI